ncbi:PREDICTED: dentin sialophospho [Prunus dulcis]|uniref:PREDICTED: dentin sialophospho n=1 Tax=Prunus dulcis TaxID=3755 RepID=A0A5E4EPC3_PRUDU|nr:uncharacterized protein LOC117621174 [Prunus dulcis]KAI5340284.1 hypothetical protein L3X38_019558 [Prunus dulcis]VVA17577.1 PREDICTED: dentin sialophospho [Prunus dulcis]
MAMEIPTDMIKEVQISLRREAKMSSYDPDDTPLPNLPSVEETIADLDPSPPYLRCKHCKGRLLRGVQSLICAFCGREHCKDLPPDPINFRDTFGYRWLLKSLSLDGSEIVELPTGADEFNRGQTARKDDLSLSDLLNLEIKWTSKPEKVETDFSNETLTQPKSLPDLAGVNLDNFFSEGKKDAAVNISEEQLFESSTQTTGEEINAFEVRETLSLFENVQPFETVVESTEGESGDSFSGWAANFQSAASETLPHASETLPHASENLHQASENIPQESKVIDPFVGSTVDLSAHIDTVFGSAVDSTDEKSNHSMTGSAPLTTDWFQGDLLGVSNSGFAGGPEQFETLAEVKGITENVNNSFPADVDWVQDNQLQTTSNKAPDNKTTDEDEDSFDAWNDFATSNSAPNLADSSLKQSTNQTTPVDQTSVVDLFGTASNSGDLNFGSLSQPDFSAGAFNSSNGSTVVDMKQADSSVLDSLVDLSTKDEKKSEDVAEGGDVSGARTGSKSEDEERIMSQMHDLSFMLESSLSIPPKRDELHSHSQD